MYSIKVIKGSVHKVYQCPHYTVTYLTDDAGIETGIEIELGTHGPTLKLPDDGDVVYATLAEKPGETVDSYRWPPRQKQQPKNQEVIST